MRNFKPFFDSIMPRRTVDDNPMPKRQSSELDYMIKIIDIEKIDPSPFQRRKYFNEHKLKELAASIQREGLIVNRRSQLPKGREGKSLS